MHVVVDTSPLIVLTGCGQLELLSALATTTVVPRTVLEELKTGEAGNQAAKAVETAPWIEITEPLPMPEAFAAWDLGAAESAVLTWAFRHQDRTAILDDGAARRCARAGGVAYISTLALVLAAKDAEIIPAARPIVDAMIQAGYSLADDMVRKALRDRGELG